MQIEKFHLIDRITDLDFAERTIDTEAAVPATSTIFEGHFPGHPLLPGVLLIETMAQSAGWLIIALTQFKRMPFLAAVREAKFRTFVQPGQNLVGAATIAHEGSGYYIADTQILLNGRQICSASITFRLMPFPSIDFENRMRDHAEGLNFPFKALADG
jgi:3-hydroxyacyl-[acyl-carrier-protein] dehydratase